MNRYLLAALLLFLPLVVPAQTTAPEAAAEAPAAPGPQVVMETSLGNITLELDPAHSPKSVANFLQYVRDGFYDGTVFHRAIAGYLVQGGLYTRNLQPKRTRAAIASEADNGLSNLRGTIAVARGADPSSGTAQFFINLVDNRRLDYAGSQSGLTWGYAVFGKVVKGMDVIDRIAAEPTRGLGPFAADVPMPLVLIKHAYVVGEQGPAAAASSAAPASAASAPRQPAPKAAGKPAGKSAGKPSGKATAAPGKQPAAGRR